MILNNIEKITEYIPTAAGLGPNELKPFIEEAEQWFQDKLSGPDLHTPISGMEATNDLKRNAQAVICLKAYETTIPFVDLIRTPNGFAVVSNSNQAPAFAFRTEIVFLTTGELRNYSGKQDLLLTLSMRHPFGRRDLYSTAIQLFK